VKWSKRGLLFDLARVSLPNGCTEFAQSPQALVLDDVVRVYFSTRSRDGNGQYVSQVGYADFDPAMRRLIATATAPVIALGDMGCFDEHGIFPFNVVRDQHRIVAFTCGWSRRVSVPVETAIGIAVSNDDGRTFQRLGRGPVMGPTASEPFLVGDPFVLVRDGRWHMWYIYGTAWIDCPTEPGPARVYKIAHAVSSDGRSWQRDSAAIVADALGDEECQALPTVFECDGRWHMYFCYRHATDFRTNSRRGYRLGYAWSRDLTEWTRDDAAAGIDVSPSGWDSEMLCYPHVFRRGAELYMLYNGNAFGRGGFGLAVMDAA
jgi:hypothetical protein